MNRHRKAAKSGLKRGLLATCALAMALTAAPAFAQSGADFDRGKNTSVSERARPDYDAVGLQWGVFDVRPKLAIGVETDDNVFYQQSNERDDIVTTINPELKARTNWSRNAAELTIGLNDRSYQDFDSEKRTDEYVNGLLKLEIVGDTALTVGASLANYGESRQDPDSPTAGAKPGDVTATEAYADLTAVFARTRISGRLTHRELEFDAVALIGGGFSDAPERDRKETGVSVRAEYALSPDTSVFAEAGVENRDYKLRPPQATFNRDNDVQKVSVGANFDISALMRGEISVGYFDQNFDAAGLAPASGLALAGQVEWFPQEMTTVTLSASRQAEETNIGTAGAFVGTEGEARIDHELLVNVILTGRLGFGQREFEGIDRTDDLASAGLGVRYLVNPSVEIGAGWTHQRQESTGAQRDRDYDVNRLGITLTLRR